MLAVSNSDELIATDDLLSWLHDPDPEVRTLCETALRGRNLDEKHLKLGRLITDARPAVRLEVLRSLRSATDLEPGVWLHRLSHDPAPAVRAAAVRAATESFSVNLTDRIRQIAQADPNDTVRQIARHYLSYQQPSPASFPQR
jgi:hypothetical protein